MRGAAGFSDHAGKHPGDLATMNSATDRRRIVLPRDDELYRSHHFQPSRRQWPGMLVAGIAIGAVAAIAMSNVRNDDPVRAAAEPVRAVSFDRAPSLAGADAGITAAVRAALAADPTLAALPIAVNTQDGVVTLSGPAPDEPTRERAAVVAGAPEGVRGVDNRLLVLPAALRS
jgi:BON domain